MQATIDMLSDEAREALTNTRGTRIGTRVPTGLDHVTIRELMNANLIGGAWGLTIRGSAVAEKLQNAQMDDLF